MMDSLLNRLNAANHSLPYYEREFEAVCGWLREDSSWTKWVPVPVEPTRNSFGSWAVALIIAIAIVNAVLCFGMGVAVHVFRKRTIVRLRFVINLLFHLDSCPTDYRYHHSTSEPIFLYIMIFGSILISVGCYLSVLH